MKIFYKSLVVALLSLCFLAVNTHAQTLLYVSNPYPSSSSNFGKITAFNPASNGLSAPVLTITQPTGNWSLALDSSLRLYSQQFLSPSDISVYPPYANGNATPSATIFAYERDATGIVVDSQGYIYVAAGTNTGSAYIEAFAPNATSPFAIIPLNALADGITVDNQGNVIVTTWGRFDPSTSESLPNALLVFAPQLAGGAPTRIIGGPATGLDSLHTDFGSGGFRVSYSKLTGRIYTGVSGGSPGLSKVSVFDSHATGNAAPLRVISGNATGLKSFIHGVAGNPVTGEIFVLSNDGAFTNGPGIITVYSQLADGNVAPIRTITDASSQFISSLDIAFSSPPIVSINAGGTASGNFVADTGFSGGASVAWANAVDTSSLVGIAPPQNVLRNDREGNFTYTISGLTPNSTHSITLYFVENYFTAIKKRVFNVTANGSVVLNNFDVFAEAGARFKAIQRSIVVNANASGAIVLQFNASVDQAKVGAIVIN